MLGNYGGPVRPDWRPCTGCAAPVPKARKRLRLRAILRPARGSAASAGSAANMRRLALRMRMCCTPPPPPPPDMLSKSAVLGVGRRCCSDEHYPATALAALQVSPDSALCHSHAVYKQAAGGAGELVQAVQAPCMLTLVRLSAVPTRAAGGRQGAVRMFQPEEVSSPLLQVMRNEQRCHAEVFIRCAESCGVFFFTQGSGHALWVPVQVGLTPTGHWPAQH